MIDRFTLKFAARRRMAFARPSPYAVTLLFLVITTVVRFIVERLVLKLSEWTEYLMYLLYGSMTGGDAELHSFFQEAWGKSGLIMSRPVYDKSIWLPIVLSLALALLVRCVAVGYDSYCLKVSRGEEARYGELKLGFRFVTKTFVISVVQGVIVAVLTCLLIIPGIIAAYAYRMTVFNMLDHPDWGPIRCMRESRLMMRGHKAQLFMLDLSFLPWYILCAITMGILYIWKLPHFTTTYALFYGELCGRSSWDFEDPQPDVAI